MRAVKQSMWLRLPQLLLLLLLLLAQRKHGKGVDNNIVTAAIINNLLLLLPSHISHLIKDQCRGAVLLSMFLWKKKRG
jgi:hypothetical protein